MTGSNTIAILCFTTGNKIDWNKNYINWNTDKICLSILSGTVGSESFTADPQNVIYKTDVDANSLAGSGGKQATTPYTLYKCTHKMVPYEYNGTKYIIYAYCYPGKKKQCILGYASYGLDSNGRVKLHTKREFCDKDGNSFSPLTDCARIIDMTYRDLELWITWVTSDESTIKCFHIRPSSFINL